ncbi:unnamed protein product [Caenorhabditis brenneri]
MIMLPIHPVRQINWFKLAMFVLKFLFILICISALVKVPLVRNFLRYFSPLSNECYQWEWTRIVGRHIYVY